MSAFKGYLSHKNFVRNGISIRTMDFPEIPKCRNKMSNTVWWFSLFICNVFGFYRLFGKSDAADKILFGALFFCFVILHSLHNNCQFKCTTILHEVLNGYDMSATYILVTATHELSLYYIPFRCTNVVYIVIFWSQCNANNNEHSYFAQLLPYFER